MSIFLHFILVLKNLYLLITFINIICKNYINFQKQKQYGEILKLQNISTTILNLYIKRIIIATFLLREDVQYKFHTSK